MRWPPNSASILTLNILPKSVGLQGSNDPKSWPCSDGDLSVPCLFASLDWAGPRHVQCLSQDVCNASGRAQWSSSAGEASGACRYSAGSYLPSDSTCPSTSVTVSSSASIEATPFLCPQQLPAVCLYSCPRVFPPARSHLTFMPLDSSVRAVWAALCLVHIQPRPPVSCSAFTSCSPQGSKGLSCFPGPDILYSSKPKYWSVVQGKETVSVPSSKYPKLVLSLHALYVLCFPTVPLDTGDTWYILQHQER